MLRHLPALTLLSLAACADTPPASVATTDARTADPDGGPATALTDTGPPPPRRDGGPAPDERCPGHDTADYIYLLAHAEGLDTVLFRFAPRTTAFERIGPVDCGTMGGALGEQPSSFAVARDGTAWVLLQRGGEPALHRLDLTDGSCDPTELPLGSSAGAHFMAFASDVPDGEAETLFASSANGDWFGRIALGAAPTSTDLGELGTNRGSRVMITGTAAAELWAISQPTVDPSDDTAVLTSIDRATGAALAAREFEAPLFVHSGVSAFAFWGGDFYLFTSGSGRPGTVVSRFRPSDGSYEEVAAHDALAPIGVAVSTCVPTELI